MSDSLSSVNYFAPVQDQMILVEERILSQADDHNPELRITLDHLLSSGGKRVRPAVALLTGGMLGGDDERLVTLAAAIELLHTATLIHDDLIDGAILRRGITTLNAKWSPAATVLTGDFIFARAAKLAAETDSVSVMRLFADTLATIVGGEITQMFASQGLASRENYDQRIYAKTASMFELATAAASMLSPVEFGIIDAVRRYGYSIGMAFQIVDDILDFTGEQATVGKPVASDLRQGLITLPALYYLETNPGDPRLMAIMMGNNHGDFGLDKLVESIRESGAIQRAMQDARAYVDEGLFILTDMPENAERKSLEDLARYIVDRHL